MHDEGMEEHGEIGYTHNDDDYRQPNPAKASNSGGKPISIFWVILGIIVIVVLLERLNLV